MTCCSVICFMGFITGQDYWMTPSRIMDNTYCADFPVSFTAGRETNDQGKVRMKSDHLDFILILLQPVLEEDF